MTEVFQLTQEQAERMEWERDNVYRGVSKLDIYAYPDRYDLPAFACGHERAEAFDSGSACAGCKAQRARRRAWIEVRGEICGMGDLRDLTRLLVP